MCVSFLVQEDAVHAVPGEVARQGLSISKAAAALHTSQPGVSKQLALLETELGVTVFTRNRNRISELTAAGHALLTVAQRMLDDAETLKRLAQDFGSEKSGSLTVLTTHTQARYALPAVVKRFTAQYPEVRLNVRQGTPGQIWQAVAAGEADLAIASEPQAPLPGLVLLRCYELPRIVLAPARHPLLRAKPLARAIHSVTSMSSLNSVVTCARNFAIDMPSRPGELSALKGLPAKPSI